MSEIQLIGDYFLIRQEQNLNALQETVKQSKSLPNHEAVDKILKNMEQVCQKLTDDILLLIPLESPNAWNNSAQLSRIMANIQKNLIKDDVELPNDAVSESVDPIDGQTVPILSSQLSLPSIISSKIQSTPANINNKTTTQSNQKHSEDKSTQTRARKCGEIQSILVAQTQIAKQHQKTENIRYENWPLNFDENKRDGISNSGMDSRRQSKANSEPGTNLDNKPNMMTQTNDHDDSKWTRFFHNNMRFFTTKSKNPSNFYVNLHEYRK